MLAHKDNNSPVITHNGKIICRFDGDTAEVTAEVAAILRRVRVQSGGQK